MENNQNGRSQSLYKHAKTRIPAGTQLFSKRPERFLPDQWPAYFSKANGCEIWDLDNRHYYDMTINCVGACLLGYADPDISEAVINRIKAGSICTLNAPEEVQLADELCEIHPWAQQVRYARTGGEMTSIAVRIARATTNRSVVAISGYHGWHDWYLAANIGESNELDGHLLPGLNPLGVPRQLCGTAVTFMQNDRQQLEDIIKEHGDNLAAVIMEPCRGKDPEPGFLEFVREKTHQCGALMIMDEITVGWRLNFGGAHLKLGVMPDMAVFAKAMGNGHPIAAVIGTTEAMEGAHQSFISSTYWTESVGPVAALATIKKMRQIDVPAYVAKIGQKALDNWQELSKKHGLEMDTENCYPALSHFSFKHKLANELKTLYTQLMLERGFLANTCFYPTMAHTDKIISLYADVVDEVFAELASALAKNKVKDLLKGPVAHTGFTRLLK